MKALVDRIRDIDDYCHSHDCTCDNDEDYCQYCTAASFLNNLSDKIIQIEKKLKINQKHSKDQGFKEQIRELIQTGNG